MTKNIKEAKKHLETAENAIDRAAEEYDGDNSRILHELSCYVRMVWDEIDEILEEND